MKPSRKQFVAAALGAYATLGVVRSRAAAADFTYKLGHDQPMTHPIAIRAAEAAQKVKDESGGRLQIDVFPNNQLGNDTAMIQQVRAGALQMLIVADGTLSAVVPVTAIENIPFAFASYKQAFDALDGPLGSNTRLAITKAGLYAFEKPWCTGFKQITTSAHAVNGPDDVKGLKIRVPPAPIELELFKALQASPTPINFAEAYVSLQTHLVDGAELPMVTINSSKFYEVQKYVAVTNHLFTGYWLIANGDAWHALPPELRAIVERNFNAAAVHEQDDIASLDASLQSTLRDKGMTVTRPDPAPFRAVIHAAGLYKEWSEKFGPDAWTLLEKTSGTLG